MEGSERLGGGRIDREDHAGLAVGPGLAVEPGRVGVGDGVVESGRCGSAGYWLTMFECVYEWGGIME